MMAQENATAKRATTATYPFTEDHALPRLHTFTLGRAGEAREGDGGSGAPDFPLDCTQRASNNERLPRDI